MKKMPIYKILTVLVTAIIIIAACTKETSDVKIDPTLSTSQVLNVKSDSATVVGFVVAAGDGFTERGVCYNTEAEPTTANNKVIYTGTSKQATFNVALSGLAYATMYYARAYAINASGTIYGDELTFTTLPVVPTLSTTEISAITGNSATGGGEVTNSGGADVTVRGICISTSKNPTIKDTVKAHQPQVTTDGKGTGAFTSSLSKLKYLTTFYVRAYATNSAGTGYGPEVSFTTLVDLPVVTTTAVTNITEAGNAQSGGAVTDNGGAEITSKGICWSTAADPTITDSKTTDGTGTSSFVSNITGLTMNTTYHVRAYAVNSAGVGYGPDITFMTFPPALYMIGDGVGGWDWANIDLPMIPVNSHPNMFWKIVWIEASGGFKFAPGKAWVNDFGKTGDAIDGVYNKGGDNIPVPGTAGYYMVVVDLAAAKIAIAAPKVYLIGNTVGSWDTSNPDAIFTVDNTNSVVTITKTLAADEIRMYAWHTWFTDWWQSEFIVLNNKIEFRGKGGDQTRVKVTAGSKTVNLNFKTGDGSIQ